MVTIVHPLGYWILKTNLPVMVQEREAVRKIDDPEKAQHYLLDRDLAVELIDLTEVQ